MDLPCVKIKPFCIVLLSLISVSPSCTEMLQTSKEARALWLLSFPSLLFTSLTRNLLWKRKGYDCSCFTPPAMFHTNCLHLFRMALGLLPFRPAQAAPEDLPPIVFTACQGPCLSTGFLEISQNDELPRDDRMWHSQVVMLSLLCDSQRAQLITAISCYNKWHQS